MAFWIRVYSRYIKMLEQQQRQDSQIGQTRVIRLVTLLLRVPLSFLSQLCTPLFFIHHPCVCSFNLSFLVFKASSSNFFAPKFAVLQYFVIFIRVFALVHTRVPVPAIFRSCVVVLHSCDLVLIALLLCSYCHISVYSILISISACLPLFISVSTGFQSHSFNHCIPVFTQFMCLHFITVSLFVHSRVSTFSFRCSQFLTPTFNPESTLLR